MRRTNVNFAIDSAAFVAFLSLLSTGLLLAYTLPPGSGGLRTFTAGHQTAERPVLSILGLTRHEWGTIHFWIAIILVLILVFHIALHWKWIGCVVRGNRGGASGLRLGLGLVAVVALLGIAAIPLVSPIAQGTRGTVRKDVADSAPMSAAIDNIRGSATISDVAEAAELSVEELVERLSLPRGVGPDDRVGPTLRRNGMRMSDLKAVLNKARTQREGKGPAILK